MGVLGLAPFIQKTYPEVIKVLPSRLQSLSGKTVVFDGTLITQRLHFAPMPHPYRHVLGWYRIMQELKACNVHAICVFDGKERNVAKQMEIQRRRHIRMETTARSVFESERLQRLRLLSTILSKVRKHDSSRLIQPEDDEDDLPLYRSQNALVQDQLGDFEEPELDEILLEDDDDISNPYPPTEAALEPTTSPLSQLQGISTNKSSAEISLPGDTDKGNDGFPNPPTEVGLESNMSPLSQLQESTSKYQPSAEISLPGDADYNRLPLDLTSKSVTDEPSFTSEIPSPVGVFLIQDQDLFSNLALLQSQYQQSIKKLISIPTPDLPTQAAVVTTTLLSSETQAKEVQVEYTMSKTQDQLTAEEGKFWDQVMESPSSIDNMGAIEPVVRDLEQKSSVLFESYHRRTNPPTVETYEESRQILYAMGVPCIETEGAVEAEALASSLVINGFADYVASEDTDVLVYEAPLIRNIANRTGPISIISGSDVRSLMQLSKPSFIDFALLLGTDFSPRIKNIGPRRALNFIRTYGSIERVLAEEPQFPPRMSAETYLAQVELARVIFRTLPATPPQELLQQGKYDESETASILMRYGLQRAVVPGFCYSDALSGNFFNDNPSAS